MSPPGRQARADGSEGGAGDGAEEEGRAEEAHREHEEEGDREVSEGAAQNSTTGAGAGSTASDATAGQSTAAASTKTRAPLDPEKRAATARRAKVRSLTKKVSGAKSEEEFWALAEDLAKKTGKTITRPDAAPPAATTEPADPKDKPLQPGWPTVRQVEKATDTASVLLAQLVKLTKGTRYEESAVAACGRPPVVKFESGGDFVVVDKGEPGTMTLPLAACIATYLDDAQMGPGTALVVSAAMAFGPTAAAHGYEVVTKWLDSREQAAVALPAPQSEKPAATKKAA